MSSNTSGHQPLVGWQDSSDDRGSLDVLWSCLVTLLLCAWVSTYPNAGSPHDKWYHPLLDKFNLAIITFLGPDFLFGIALGQFSSARSSVKAFKRDSHLTRGQKWKLIHGFFVDMGCLHLTAPDYSIADGKSFPIDAKQFHYLVKHGFVEFPDIDKLEIKERNSVDTLSRIITVFQAAWFTIKELARIHKGYPISTLELTTLSFCFITFVISALWYHKPSISKPQFITTKDDITIEEIPHKLRINFVSRPVSRTPWDRVPSDIWLIPEPWFAPGAALILIGFSVIFVLAWNFQFPTASEKLLWRICSAYHAAFSIYGGAYYAVEMFKPSKRKKAAPIAQLSSQLRTNSMESIEMESQRRVTFGRRRFLRFVERARVWRNLSEDQDPEMEVPLRVIIPITVACFVYCLCRFYIYIEDLISLRLQPAEVLIHLGYNAGKLTGNITILPGHYNLQDL
ncbi:oxidoreductase [Fusarium tjaetaba]|uniref:Oxidoreductase n=1 Tax=Fusarium tjaetaba TaxID=1567544 RepID=A0A8H5W1H4_9HYPO|nr:oxidoreductase [Fusarium tjaetaba]KAF5643396.1 oxidoreductase [Fusarium tjaetaba]